VAGEVGVGLVEPAALEQRKRPPEVRFRGADQQLRRPVSSMSSEAMAIRSRAPPGATARTRRRRGRHQRVGVVVRRAIATASVAVASTRSSDASP
jgi:hypothetical protein